MQTVVIGLSGGVDSSVAALLLKEQGYRVIGMFMKNWDDGDAACTAREDFEDVVAVCSTLDIPYYTINFTEEYRERVFADFLAESRAGRTPNPDILCNREIKFHAFLEKALELGADLLATGHYCQNPVRQGKHHLVRGADPGKDQSYFLYTLQAEILSKVLFPIGHLPKMKVRQLAKEAGLITAGKKDSTGICFIGERNFRQFLKEHLPMEPGPFKDVDGNVIGEHIGLPFYTIGQRKGIGIGGAGEAWFVVDKDSANNTVILAQGAEHPALFSSRLVASQLSWVNVAPTPGNVYGAKVRYRQEDQLSRIEWIEEGKMALQFERPLRAVTPGQSVVLYDGDICLGGGVIETRC